MYVSPPGRITDSTPANQSADVPQSERDKKFAGKRKKTAILDISVGD